MMNGSAQSSVSGAARDLAALLALAAAWRALFLWASPRVLDTADAIHYCTAAQTFAAGGWLDVDPKIPVLYPLLGAALSIVIPDVEWALRAISLAASCLLIVPLYFIARPLHGPATARWAGLVAALWPWLADYACAVATEPLAMLAWFSAAALLLRTPAGSTRSSAGAGIAALALCLTRAEGLFVAAAALVLAAILLPQGADTRNARGKFGSAAIILGAGLAVNSAYVRALTGQLTPNYRTGFIVDEFNLLRFLDTAMKSVTDVAPVMLGPVLGLLLGAGLFLPGLVRRNARAEAFLLALAAAHWIATWFVLSPAPRYLMAPLLVLSLWSCRGLALVTALLAESRATARFRFAPAAACVALFMAQAAVTLGAEYAGRQPRQPREYKAAGLWMRDHLEPALIFTRKPQIAWYAGMPSTGPADSDSPEEILTRARHAQARYLVADERYAPPGMRAWLDPAHAPEGLELLHLEDSVPHARVAVYRVRPEQAP